MLLKILDKIEKNTLLITNKNDETIFHLMCKYFLVFPLSFICSYLNTIDNNFVYDIFTVKNKNGNSCVDYIYESKNYCILKVLNYFLIL